MMKWIINAKNSQLKIVKLITTWHRREREKEKDEKERKKNSILTELVWQSKYNILGINK